MVNLGMDPVLFSRGQISRMTERRPMTPCLMPLRLPNRFDGLVTGGDVTCTTRSHVTSGKVFGKRYNIYCMPSPHSRQTFSGIRFRTWDSPAPWAH
ncbi:hypothetical protein AVEN_53520-1 [Araneus ventricosus]|uniref:Uncharacterized protein n=1 Tax=Araneus ventricosus TaxID=182803 RepID=A0A4Y2UVX1_ARAVE|nr:hypothetical protein AVEN_53520-1 [Araneus ventricosus]